MGEFQDIDLLVKELMAIEQCQITCGKSTK